jgi:hypothetical protein
MKRTTFFAAIALLAALVVGCYTSKYTVGSADAARVDKAYVGDWEMKDGDKTTLIVIRNLDDKRYYVEMKGSPDEKTTRYVGFIGAVNDVQFANLRELTDDGTIPDEHLIMRVALKDGKLTLRNLKQDFFKDKTIDSQDKLVALLEKNLDNEAMYDQDSIVATRKAQ